MKYENPNFCTFLVIVYNLCVVGGFLFIIFEKDLSLWWTLLASCCMISYKNDNKKVINE